jgi:glycosyltransferase involved in cell wall biosynthesis
MRVVALLTTHNEARFVAACIEHLRAQGVAVHLTDNGSDDGTVQIAERYLGDGVIAIEDLPRGEFFEWGAVLRNKQRLAAELDADWFIHHDADEFRVSPDRGRTLVDELRAADEAGFTAVNFLEFTFLPVAEEPDHDHARFLETMRWYHPFLPWYPHRVNAWKRQAEPVDLAGTGGHIVKFDGLALSPRSLYMRHYLYLGAVHALEKYVYRRYSPFEAAARAHGWRSKMRPEDIVFPPAAELRPYRGDQLLDPSSPRRRHYIDERMGAAASETA